MVAYCQSKLAQVPHQCTLAHPLQTLARPWRRPWGTSFRFVSLRVCAFSYSQIFVIFLEILDMFFFSYLGIVAGFVHCGDQPTAR